MSDPDHDKLEELESRIARIEAWKETARIGAGVLKWLAAIGMAVATIWAALHQK
jgi:hypothetical protein